MKINFDKNISGFQNARRLKIMLEQQAHSATLDTNTRTLIETIIAELDEFISSPEFTSFSHSKEFDTLPPRHGEQANPLLVKCFSIWRALFGPGRQELLLSRQRQELIERAEQAEALAYDALAETAEVGRQRDAAIRKLKELGIEFTPKK